MQHDNNAFMKEERSRGRGQQSQAKVTVERGNVAHRSSTYQLNGQLCQIRCSLCALKFGEELGFEGAD